jgi:protein ImuB
VRFVPWGDAREADRPELEASVSPWPGAVPPPAPALVHEPPLEVAVVDRSGAPVAVMGRGWCSAPPALVGEERIVGWAGPWPVDERWWDPPAHRRRARFQLLTSTGTAYLAAVEGGRWWIEATYD